MNLAVGQETQSSRSASTTFAVSKSVRHTVFPPGRIKRMAAAVLLDDVVETVEKDGKKSSTRRKHTDDELKQIGQLAAAAIGMDTQRGDLLSAGEPVVPGIAGGNSSGAHPPGPGAAGIWLVGRGCCAISRSRPCLSSSIC